jgi:predicted O-methyltransferase YrrM
MSALVWTTDHDFTVGGVEYRSIAWAGEDTGRDEQLVVLKPRHLVERYEVLVDELKPRTIVELGIYQGGSVALLAQLARPIRLVALDLAPDRGRLDRFIAEQHLEDVVRLHHGVDQADVIEVGRIMAAELDGPIDLVVDDASHLEGPTRASFERLFPPLRPGGVYVIEDWAWAHWTMMSNKPMHHGARPVSALVFELMVLAGRRPGMVAEVRVDEHWAMVRRGPRPLDASSFSVADALDPIGQQMASRLRDVVTVPEP